MRQKISNFETFWCAWGHPANCVLTCMNCYVCKMKQFHIWILMPSLLPFWLLILLQQCCVSEGSFVIQSPIFLHTLAKYVLMAEFIGEGGTCAESLCPIDCSVYHLCKNSKYLSLIYFKKTVSVNHSISPVFQR